MRSGEAGEMNEVRKSEPACELLIFEFCPSQGVKVTFHMCQITKQNVNKHDSVLDVDTFMKDGQTSWMAR